MSNAAHSQVLAVRAWMEARVLGQPTLVHRLLVALMTGGHLLVEGAPGLAKTRAVKELARSLEGSFQRIQFTPDLLPSDITGSEIYRPETGSFEFQRGPVFHNLVLADEINRAPAKVQSALLEAMGEHQVTYGRHVYALPEPFLVMATQNPIEQEGTYPLPEAQLDRFLLHVEVHYPDAKVEREILALVRREAGGSDEACPVRLDPPLIAAVRREVLDLHMAPPLEEYIVQLVLATREPRFYGNELASWIRYGASPRGTIALDQCARAAAWLDGRDYVTPADVQAMAHDVLRHRILRSFEAIASEVGCNQIIDTLLARVPAP